MQYILVIVCVQFMCMQLCVLARASA